MNPIPDWVDDVSEDAGTLSAALKDLKKFIATKTAISYGKTACAAMALPLLAYAGPFDVPAIKPVQMLNDHVMLATSASSAAPVQGPSAGVSISVGSSDVITIAPAYGVIAHSKINK